MGADGVSVRDEQVWSRVAGQPSWLTCDLFRIITRVNASHKFVPVGDGTHITQIGCSDGFLYDLCVLGVIKVVIDGQVSGRHSLMLVRLLLSFSFRCLRQLDKPLSHALRLMLPVYTTEVKHKN